MHLHKLQVVKVTAKRITARDRQTTYSLSREALEQTGYVQRGRHVTIYAGWNIQRRIERYLEGIEKSIPRFEAQIRELRQAGVTPAPYGILCQ